MGQKPRISDVFYKMLFPSELAKEQVAEGKAMCADRYEYIRSMSEFDKISQYKSDYAMSDKDIKSLLTKNAFEVYQCGYDYYKRQRRREVDKMLEEEFREYSFNSPKRCEKYIAALETILYNAIPGTVEHSVLKITGWVQWFRNSFAASKQNIAPTALVFYSSLGGTGKGYIVEAFKEAFAEFDVKVGNVTLAGLCDKFLPEILPDVNVLAVSEADFANRIGHEINNDKLNPIIDRDEFDFARKFRGSRPIRPKHTLIMASNQLHINRRFSIIPIQNRSVSNIVNPPTKEQLKEACIDLIMYCPDPDIAYKDVVEINQNNPQLLTPTMLALYDYFLKSGGEYPTETVRGILKYVYGRNEETTRRHDLAKKEVMKLVGAGVFEQIFVPSNKSFETSSMRADMDKFHAYIGEMSEYKLANQKSVADSVIDNYILPMKIDFRKYRRENKKVLDICAAKKKAFEARGVKGGDEYIQNNIKLIEAELDIKGSVKLQRVIREFRKKKQKNTS